MSIRVGRARIRVRWCVDLVCMCLFGTRAKYYFIISQYRPPPRSDLSRWSFAAFWSHKMPCVSFTGTMCSRLSSVPSLLNIDVGLRHSALATCMATCQALNCVTLSCPECRPIDSHVGGNGDSSHVVPLARRTRATKTRESRSISR